MAEPVVRLGERFERKIRFRFLRINYLTKFSNKYISSVYCRKGEHAIYWNVAYALSTKNRLYGPNNLFLVLPAVLRCILCNHCVGVLNAPPYFILLFSIHLGQQTEDTIQTWELFYIPNERWLCHQHH